MRNAKLKVEGILLDLDGTIVDSKKAYQEAIKVAFKKMGCKISPNKALALEIPRRLELNHPIEELLNGIEPSKFLRIYLDTYYQITRLKAKPFPNVSATLEHLSEKARLALITMRHVPKEKIIEELDGFRLTKYFDYVITAFDTSLPKPSPEALIKCSINLNVKLHKCAVVGDSVADIRAGKNAGAKTVAVLSGIFTKEELEREKPDLILRNVNQFACFLA